MILWVRGRFASVAMRGDGVNVRLFAVVRRTPKGVYLDDFTAQPVRSRKLRPGVGVEKAEAMVEKREASL